MSFTFQSLSFAPLGREGIFPGTIWCGAGNLAYSRDDLGIFPGPDRCCRNHDQCPLKLQPFQRRFGLFNARLHTVSHCACDEVRYCSVRTERKLICLYVVHQDTTLYSHRIYFCCGLNVCFDRSGHSTNLFIYNVGLNFIIFYVCLAA
jgi:hypothetical protein